MPGTVASAVTALMWYNVPPIGLGYGIVVALILFFIGVVTASIHSQALGDRDPACVVIDEVFGMSIALLAAAHTPKAFVLAFVLFRIFDIFKPFPINRLQDFEDGWGIMLDDGAAGIAACLFAWLLAMFVTL